MSEVGVERSTSWDVAESREMNKGGPRSAPGGVELTVPPPPGPPAPVPAEEMRRLKTAVDESAASAELAEARNAAASKKEASKNKVIPEQSRCLCSLGTGEIVHILAFSAQSEDEIDPFERIVQDAAREFYALEAGITDVRICHPMRGRIVFVVTFLDYRNLHAFRQGPEQRLRKALRPHAHDNEIFNSCPPVEGASTIGTTEVPSSGDGPGLSSAFSGTTSSSSTPANEELRGGGHQIEARKDNRNKKIDEFSPSTRAAQTQTPASGGATSTSSTSLTKQLIHPIEREAYLVSIGTSTAETGEEQACCPQSPVGAATCTSPPGRREDGTMTATSPIRTRHGMMTPPITHIPSARYSHDDLGNLTTTLSSMLSIKEGLLVQQEQADTKAKSVEKSPNKGSPNNFTPAVLNVEVDQHAPRILDSLPLPNFGYPGSTPVENDQAGGATTSSAASASAATKSSRNNLVVVPSLETAVKTANKKGVALISPSLDNLLTSKQQASQTVASAATIFSSLLGGRFVTNAYSFEATGSLMPAAHTLKSLLKKLVKMIKGRDHRSHPVRDVAEECKLWFPRDSEVAKFVSWNAENPSKYTRNLIYKNEAFECLLMCWPAHSVSSIHCHDESSCWVVAVGGEVVEVQYAQPKLDRKFLEAEARNPRQALGRCAPLRKLSETTLGFDAVRVGYANQEIALHRIENRTDEPAYTMHIYAPGLEKIRIFQECGTVSVAVMPVCSTSETEDREDDHEDEDNALPFVAALWNEKESVAA
ncbi:unnamed protein product [Amoebophrya sp. A25]|nr:unnamed protein product [Amoebophrya sp. A25]|eukprot:GSA25T00019844001.1